MRSKIRIKSFLSEIRGDIFFISAELVNPNNKFKTKGGK